MPDRSGKTLAVGKLALAAYVLVIHGLLLGAVLRPDLGQRAAAKLRLRPPLQQGDPCHERVHTAYRRADLNAPQNGVVFIGDSLIQGLAVSAVVERAINYGIDGDKAAQVLQRLRDYPSLERARAIVLAVGVNDLGSQSNEQIVNAFAALLEAMPHAVPVIVSSILPKDERIADDVPNANARIRAINRRVQALCARRSSVRFLDVASALTDADANLASTLHEGDGLHLNARGNALWIGALREAVAQIAPRE